MKELYATSSHVDRSQSWKQKPKSQWPGNGQVTLSFLLKALFHSNLSSDDGKARLLEGVGEAHVPACVVLPVVLFAVYPTSVRPDMVVACSR